MQAELLGPSAGAMPCATSKCEPVQGAWLPRRPDDGTVLAMTY